MKEDKRFRIHVAVYLILEKDEKLWLIRRYNTNYMNGYYTTIAGHLDGNESATDAVIREAKEEAGIDVARKDVFEAYIAHRHNPDREYIDMYFVASQWDGEPANMEPNKADEIGWFDKHNLPENMVPEIRFAIQEIVEGKHYGEYGWDKL
ncbi:MAG: NUDIX hydrolase [Candidatus Magasanikbacteria bacterium CG_4_9_14_0_2_um_filter_42_11]|uniref:NUDIX hydrolase n=1 Tax=Candidatus Magasanikbacteria bacterium CG_4_9_14_0_2_um_filter_42_11 TaxID=1974643 RepID=A0A2M8F8J8_9BACT|nr:MAG: NUDIX hydrolase [Candidatus Magasanikbacteria bacterium CG10_big_fil_rev_8_21_14_0_10_43_9]PIY92217.1 MAG: NUDIX hydrolase [Candidatus Magasanikbacteria bacterium CG_4_10_14_0_8_um_filter_42_12]PJC52028.1 MAG: NUDIX hydrolase [Candidatus Magasanikbacteria bacterium CG_4_9_14_0_2_um_filter_42_11]